MLGPSPSGASCSLALPLRGLRGSLAFFSGTAAASGASSSGTSTGPTGASSAPGSSSGASRVASASATVVVSFQSAAAFVALALEDEAHQAPAIQIADRVELDRPATLRVDAHDAPLPRDGGDPGRDRELERQLVADRERVGARQQES